MTDAGSLLRPRPSPVFVDHCQTDRLQERERPTHVTLGYKSFSAGLAIVCFYFRTRTTRLRGRSVCPERETVLPTVQTSRKRKTLGLRAARFGQIEEH